MGSFLWRRWKDLDRNFAQRQPAEKAPLESEAGLIRYTSDIVTVLGADGTLRYGSPSVERVLGYRPEERIGANAFEYIHPEDVERVSRALVEGLGSRGVHPPVELRFRHSDGSWRYLEVVANNLLDDPNVRGIVLTSRDVTERKRAEEELLRSEARNKAICDANPDLMFLFSRTGEFLSFKAAGKESKLCVSPEAIIGKKLGDVMSTAIADKTLYLISRALDTGEMQVYEYQLLVPEGVRSFEARLVKSGASEVLGSVRDVTERKQAERRLEESEQRYKSLFEHNPDAVYSLDLEGNFLAANAACEKLSGYKVEELLEMSFVSLIVGEDLERTLRHFEKVAKGEPRNYENAITHKDGHRIELNVTKLPILVNGEIVGVYGIAKDITGRKRAEGALRESEERFRQLFEQSVDTLLVHDENGWIVDCNSEACRSLGYSREEMLSLSVRDFSANLASDEEIPRSDALWRHTATSDLDRPVTGVHLAEHRRKDSTTFPVEVRVGFIDYDGKRMMLAAARDITDLKRAAEALQESEERFRMIFEQTSVGIAIADSDRRLRETNLAYQEMLGYSEEELYGKPVAEITYPGDASVDAELHEKAVAGSLDRYRKEKRYVRKNGGLVWVRSTVSVVRNREGDSQFFIAVIEDITERKQSEELLRQQSAAMTTSMDGVAILDEDGAYIYMNDAHAEIFGYDEPGELLGKSWKTLYESRELERLQRDLEPMLRENGQWRGEAIGKRRDGSTFPQEISLTMIEGGGRVCIARDITKRRGAEQALRESEERFRTIFEQTAVGISIADPDRRLLETNPAYQKMVGYSGEELYGKPIAELSHPDDVPMDTELNKELLADNLDRYQREKRYIRKDGESVWVRPTISVVRDAEDEPQFLIGVVEDITERRQAEEALSESERKYRSVVDSVKEVIFQTNAQGLWTFLNPAWAEITGFSVEESIGTNFLDYVHPDDRQRNQELFRPLIEREKDYCRHEIRYLTKGGGFRWIEVWARLTLSDDGTVTGTSGTLNDLTERKRTEDKMRRSESSLAKAQQIAHIGNWEYDVEKDEARWSDEMYRIFGFAPQQFIPVYKTFLDSIHADDKEFIRRSVRKTLYEGKRYSIDFRIVRRDGEVRVVYAHHEVVRGDTGRPIRLVGTVHDVTERKRIEEELRRSEARNKAILETTPDLMFLYSRDGEYLDIQANAPGKLYLPREALIGGNLRDLLPPEVAAPFLRKLTLTLDTGEVQTYEYRLTVPEGTLDFEARLVASGQDEVLCVARDVTERKALEERLAHQAFHDSLTDLPNRALFMDRLRHALAQADRRGGKVAVLFLDLDNFKVINDSLGHEVGDRLLVAVAERLRTCLRPGDTAARLGGDEFTILLEDVMYVRDATQVAERITEALRLPFNLEERQLFTSASIGIVLDTTAQDEPGDLLRDADVALYQAKGSGKAGYAVFDPSMSIHALEHLELGNDLRRALERGEFRVCYQPKVLLETGKILGMEALVRWKHPERGLLLPSEFVPVAEETGLIIHIGQRVLEEACRQARVWQEQYPDDPPLLMCVNLSARQFQHPKLAQDIARVLRETGLDPRGLCLEITESAVMKDVQSTIATLQELKDLGVKFAIDDFGTGYSSLSYLKRFPVSYLKIDRSFIDGLGGDPEDKVLVSGIIMLAHTLGMQVIAEGVETAEQLARLREMECEIAQGNYFSEPVSGRIVTKLLTSDLRW